MKTDFGLAVEMTRDWPGLRKGTLPSPCCEKGWDWFSSPWFTEVDDTLGTWALVLFSLWTQPCTWTPADAKDRAWKALGVNLGALLENAFLAQTGGHGSQGSEPWQVSIPKWVWLCKWQAWAWVQSLALGWFWSRARMSSRAFSK